MFSRSSDKSSSGTSDLSNQDIEMQLDPGSTGSSSDGANSPAFSIDQQNNIDDFNIDDDDNDNDDEDIIYYANSPRHMPLNANGKTPAWSFRLRSVIGTSKARRWGIIVFCVALALWTISMIKFGADGHLANTNKYTPVVGEGSNQYEDASWIAAGHTGDRPGESDPTTTAQGAVETQAPNTSDNGDVHEITLKKMTMDDERKGWYYVFPYSIEFIKAADVTSENDEGLYLLKSGNAFVLKKASDDSYKKVLISNGSIKYKDKEYSVHRVSVSPKLDKIICATDMSANWRHSTFGYYFVLDVESGDVKPVFITEEGQLGKLSYAIFSPKGTYVSFVYKNNIYLTSSGISKTEITQITKDGDDNIFNGRPDWMYEEEVLGDDKAIWWNEQETFFAYLKLDDTDVPVYDLDFYVKDNSLSTYPEVEPLKYSKPGFGNPLASVHVYDMMAGQDNAITHEESSINVEFVFYEGIWLSEVEFIYKITNRVSRYVEVLNYDPNLRKALVVRAIDTMEYDGWYLNNGKMLVLPDGNGYIDSIVKDGYDHLAAFGSGSTADPFNILSQGKWEVTDGALSYDSVTGKVYFIGTAGSAIERQIYAKDINIVGEDDAYVALTDNTTISAYSAKFSCGGRYALVDYQGPEMPHTSLMDMREFTVEKFFASNNLNSAKIFAENFSKYAVPTKDYYQQTIPVEEGSKETIDIDVIEVKPMNFDENKQYPVLVSVYGGPGSQKLTSQFSYFFEEVVSSNLEAIVLYIDPRGTGGRGWKYRSYARNNIGYWEPRDITSVTKALLESKSYMDPERVAIWGWSYGGFTTLKTLEYDAGNVFKYGMAVAPVTNWLLYDSIYTERYMDLPDKDESGYKTSVVTNIESFKTVQRFLLMHGSADDNVHVQNTFDLLDSFNIHGVENFDMQIFPDSNHNILHHNANTIVYDKLFSWLRDAFQGDFKELGHK